jgi:hypothetical protein
LRGDIIYIVLITHYQLIKKTYESFLVIIRTISKILKHNLYILHTNMSVNSKLYNAGIFKIEDSGGECFSLILDKNKVI